MCSSTVLNPPWVLWSEGISSTHRQAEKNLHQVADYEQSFGLPIKKGMHFSWKTKGKMEYIIISTKWTVNFSLMEIKATGLITDFQMQNSPQMYVAMTAQ